jgi:class 3 adenylate cyclase
MVPALQESTHGCLLIADITGYTDYLRDTELEHAQDVLADLLETIIAGIEPPFTLSKLEGDAAFAYVSSSVMSAPMLFDTVDATYFAFRRRLRDIVQSTTCTCDACVLIPRLDLKFFVHEGEYVIRRIARSEELTGSDVVLIHRLLKGAAGQVAGSDAFAVYTGAALEALGVDAQILGFLPFTESLPDMDDVDVFVQNLEEQWTKEQVRTRVFVTEEEAVARHEMFFSAQPPVVWEYFTDPRKRLRWQLGLTSIDEDVEGRRGVDTINHCAHGSDVITQRVADWRPFSTFTTVDALEGTPIVLTTTTDFAPADGGTTVTLRALCDPPEMSQTIAEELVPSLVESANILEALLIDEATVATAP